MNRDEMRGFSWCVGIGIIATIIYFLIDIKAWCRDIMSVVNSIGEYCNILEQRKQEADQELRPCIGFQIPSSSEDYYEEEEKASTLKGPCGFR